MSRRILKRPQAERDIEDCFVYIAGDNFEKADGFIAAVEDGLKRIAEFPNIGTGRKFNDERLQNIRMRRVKGYENYLLFYAADEKSIELIRVLQHARNIEELFS
jgi:toxin ParE1/3/4